MAMIIVHGTLYIWILDWVEEEEEGLDVMCHFISLPLPLRFLALLTCSTKAIVATVAVERDRKDDSKKT
jgi:hypothetical protein